MLEIIIPHINTKIETLEIFEKFYGLCEIIKDGEKEFPAEYCNGEYKQVSDFDKYRGSVYHRLTGKPTMEESPEEETVSCDPFYTKTFPVRTVAVIKKDLISGMGDNAYLENKIVNNLLAVIAESNNKTLRIALRVDNISIEVTGAITDRDDLFTEEYKNIDPFMRYEYVYVAIDYNIVVTGSIGCFELYTCQ